MWSQVAQSESSDHERQSQDLSLKSRLSAAREVGRALGVLSLSQIGKSRTELGGDLARALCVAVTPPSQIFPGPSWDTGVGC